MSRVIYSFIVKNINNKLSPSRPTMVKKEPKKLKIHLFLSQSLSRCLSLDARIFTFIFWTLAERLRETEGERYRRGRGRPESSHSLCFSPRARVCLYRISEIAQRENLEPIERAAATTTTRHRSCSRRREARTRRRRRRALFPEEERSQLLPLLRVNIDSFRGKALRPMIKIAEGEAKR